MMDHFAIIINCCDDVRIIADNAIFYREDGFGYCEIGEATFSCDSYEEACELYEAFGEKDLSE